MLDYNYLTKDIQEIYTKSKTSTRRCRRTHLSRTLGNKRNNNVQTVKKYEQSATYQHLEVYSIKVETPLINKKSSQI